MHIARGILILIVTYFLSGLALATKHTPSALETPRSPTIQTNVLGNKQANKQANPQTNVQADAQDLKVPRVVVSIPPFYALVSEIMQGVGKPELLIQSGASSHHAVLSPSNIKSLEQADIIFWGGPDLETFLIRPLKNIDRNKTQLVELDTTPRLRWLKTRFSANFNDESTNEDTSNNVEDHHHESGDTHANSNSHSHVHAHSHSHSDANANENANTNSSANANVSASSNTNPQPSTKPPGYRKHHKHQHSNDAVEQGVGQNVTERDNVEQNIVEDEHTHVHSVKDMHFWLDPINTLELVDAITATLEKAYPAGRAQFQINAQQLKHNIKALDKRLKVELAGIRNKPYLVLHDGYQYFENHYSLKAVGAITHHPELPISVARLQKIREIIEKEKVECIFSEPGVQAKLAENLAKEFHLRTGVLDPMERPDAKGEYRYGALLEGLSSSLRSCLAPLPPAP